ncbi:YvcK family protein [Tepidibacillus sp. HK-1]|uniref:gluconeogenesis factor YvcK family protein n=1 Tax=Tepidibacillus sp. HK-1 TaxID=1883407 RepID=UPI000853C286|nr:YvcK family protein [Tepidibacillus sp. HK-1]GBF10640.1 gluconeogenesis factor [Tepidibacillus sp. HK-1]
MGELQPKVVVIGGGTGLSVMLRGLKKQNLDLTAVVTVADDGGSSGKLRSELNMLPPGDIRNVLIALANTEPLLEKLLQHRFQQGEGLAGHSLGNLLIAAMQEITGDFVLAIKELSRVLAVKGQVLPATLQKVHLSAELTDGTIINGESNIPLAAQNRGIKRVFINPTDVKPLEDAILAIQQADAVVIGPGSLYTSVIPNLLVNGIKEEVLSTKAKKIYICNVMTQPGETDHYSAVDHVNAIEEHVGQKFIDYVIVNEGEISEEIKQQYRAENAIPVASDKQLLTQAGYRVVAESFVNYHTYLRHDAEKLSKSIIKILHHQI